MKAQAIGHTPKQQWKKKLLDNANKDKVMYDRMPCFQNTDVSYCKSPALLEGFTWQQMLLESLTDGSRAISMQITTGIMLAAAVLKSEFTICD